MKKATAALVASASIFLITGCIASTQPIQSPYQGIYDKRLQEAEDMAKELEETIKTVPAEKILKKVEEMVTYGLKDPESSRFRNLRFVKYEGRVVVCGEVNAKNSYGGYVGFENFIAGLKTWHMMKSSEAHTAAGAAENAGLNTYCNLGEVINKL